MSATKRNLGARGDGRGPARAHGFTIVESVMAMLVMSILLVAAMDVAASNGRTQYVAGERAMAITLADSLVNEIIGQAYQDPSASRVFGLEPGKVVNQRGGYADVDDYNNLVDSPPTNRDGTAIDGATGWSRSVKVDWVTGASPAAVSASETGFKRIRVTVQHGSKTILTRYALRSAAH